MNMDEIKDLLNALSFIKGKKKGLNVFIEVPNPVVFDVADGYKLIIDYENVHNDNLQRITDVVDGRKLKRIRTQRADRDVMLIYKPRAE